MIKHDEIYFKEDWTNDDAWWFEEERRIKWCLIFNKKDEILFVDLIDSLANNEDSLLLNLLIDLILEQFTKILYCNSVEIVSRI